VVTQPVFRSPPDLPRSRSALACVVAAHVAVAWSAAELLKQEPRIEPTPIEVSFIREEQPQVVDTLPQPLPVAVKSPPPPRRQPPPEPVQRQEPPPEVEQTPEPPAPEPAPQVVETPPPPPLPAPKAISEPPPVPQVAAREPEAPPVVAAIEPSRAPARPEPIESAPLFNADYLRNPTPAYPSISRRMGEQGLVKLRVFVTAGGDPYAIELKEGCGFPRLDRAAQDAVRQWKFVPARRGEQPVDAWVIVPIRFSLKG